MDQWIKHTKCGFFTFLLPRDTLIPSFERQLPVTQDLAAQIANASPSTLNAAPGALFVPLCVAKLQCDCQTLTLAGQTPQDQDQHIHPDTTYIRIRWSACSFSVRGKQVVNGKAFQCGVCVCVWRAP